MYLLVQMEMNSTRKESKELEVESRRSGPLSPECAGGQSVDSLIRGTTYIHTLQAQNERGTIGFKHSVHTPDVQRYHTVGVPSQDFNHVLPAIS